MASFVLDSFVDFDLLVDPKVVSVTSASGFEYLPTIRTKTQERLRPGNLLIESRGIDFFIAMLPARFPAMTSLFGRF